MNKQPYEEKLLYKREYENAMNEKGRQNLDSMEKNYLNTKANAFGKKLLTAEAVYRVVEKNSVKIILETFALATATYNFKNNADLLEKVKNTIEILGNAITFYRQESKLGKQMFTFKTCKFL